MALTKLQRQRSWRATLEKDPKRLARVRKNKAKASRKHAAKVRAHKLTTRLNQSPPKIAKYKPCNDVKELAKWARTYLVIPPGHPNSGQPLEIPKFALKFLKKALKRRESLLSVARKNAKSAIIAVYLLARLAPTSPFNQPGYRAGVVSVTAQKAGELWLQMRDLTLAAQDNAIREDMKFLQSGPRRVESSTGRVEFLSADKSSGHASGFDDAIIDEIGLLEERNRALVQGMRTAVLAKNGRTISISIWGFGPYCRELELRAKNDKQTYVKVYRAPKKCELDDPAAIRAANPAIADGVLTLKAILHQAQIATTAAAEEASYRALNLNQPGYGDSQETLLTVTEFNGALRQGLPQRDGPYFLGIDRGESDSLSACFAYWPETGRAEYRAIIGGKLTIQQREKRDGLPYRNAIAVGECWHDAAAVPDFQDFLSRCLGEWGQPRKVALDSYRKQDTGETLEKAGIPNDKTDWVISGPKGMDQDIRAARRLFRLGDVRLIEPSSLLAHNVAVSVIERTKFGNLIMTKLGKHSRIDICSAMILSIGLADREPMQAPLKVY